jgi:hypothetical protein
MAVSHRPSFAYDEYVQQWLKGIQEQENSDRTPPQNKHVDCCVDVVQVDIVKWC